MGGEAVRLHPHSAPGCQEPTCGPAVRKLGDSILRSVERLWFYLGHQKGNPSSSPGPDPRPSPTRWERALSTHNLMGPLCSVLQFGGARRGAPGEGGPGSGLRRALLHPGALPVDVARSPRRAAPEPHPFTWGGAAASRSLGAAESGLSGADAGPHPRLVYAWTPPGPPTFGLRGAASHGGRAHRRAPGRAGRRAGRRGAGRPF